VSKSAYHIIYHGTSLDSSIPSLPGKKASVPEHRILERCNSTFIELQIVTTLAEWRRKSASTI
jgi:hypothetical protein